MSHKKTKTLVKTTDAEDASDVVCTVKHYMPIAKNGLEMGMYKIVLIVEIQAILDHYEEVVGSALVMMGSILVACRSPLTSMDIAMIIPLIHRRYSCEYLNEQEAWM